MGCNCKKTKRIHSLLNTENGSNNISLKGTGGYISRTFQGIMLFAMLMIVFPLFTLYLMINYIISGSLSVYIPKFFAKYLNGNE